MSKDFGADRQRGGAGQEDGPPLAWPWSEYKSELPRVEIERAVVSPIAASPAPTPAGASAARGILLMAAIIAAGGLAWRFALAPETSGKSVTAQPAQTAAPAPSEAGGAAAKNTPSTRETAASSNAAAPSDPSAPAAAPDQPKPNKAAAKRHKKPKAN